MLRLLPPLPRRYLAATLPDLEGHSDMQHESDQKEGKEMDGCQVKAMQLMRCQNDIRNAFFFRK